MNRYHHYLLLLIFSLVSCIKPVEIDIPTHEPKLVVRTKPNTILSPNGKIYNRPYGPSSRRLKEYRANVKFNINYTYNSQYHSYYKTLLIECHR